VAKSDTIKRMDGEKSEALQSIQCQECLRAGKLFARKEEPTWS